MNITLLANFCGVKDIMKNKNTPNTKPQGKKLWGFVAILLTFVILSGIVSANLGVSSSQSPESDTVICITQDSALAGANVANEQVNIKDNPNAWSTKAQIDIFNHDDDSVKTDGTGSANNIIAPGTTNNYTFSLQNSKDFNVKYNLIITGGNDSTREIPIQLQILNNSGEIISGNGWTQLSDFTEVKDISSLWKLQLLP